MARDDRKAALITFDLDQTLFATKLESVRDPWIAGVKGKKAWVSFLQYLVDETKDNGIDLHFGIVTAKTFVDELVFSAMDTFIDFLDHNAHITHIPQENHYLIHAQTAPVWNEELDEWEDVFLQSEDRKNKTVLFTKEEPGCPQVEMRDSLNAVGLKSHVCVFSHSNFDSYLKVGYAGKSELILELAAQYDVKPGCCIHVDDDIYVRVDIKRAKMIAVSAEIFQEVPHDALYEDEEGEYLLNIACIQLEILSQLKELFPDCFFRDHFFITGPTEFFRLESIRPFSR